MVKLAMQPFVAFVDVESSRAHVDGLYSNDPQKCLESIICIKNSVIGSNRQKGSVIALGIIPRLMQLIREPSTSHAIRLESVVTLGSLAKGTSFHVKFLVDCNIVSLLLDVLDENDPKLLEASLCCLRTVCQRSSTVPSSLFTQKQIYQLLTFINKYKSVIIQSCVLHIFGAICHSTEDQELLCSTGVPHVVTRMLQSEHSEIRAPSLIAAANISFENRRASLELISAGIAGILVSLMSRDRPPDEQLGAARCIAYLQRAGALDASDPCVIYRCLPCLVRLCQKDQETNRRALAAETLAYLSEVDTELQRTAAISNHLMSALSELLEQGPANGRQAALRAFASLGANDEDIRKRVIETKRLMEHVLDGLEDDCPQVRLAAVRCLHSLSRSVQQLRTTFQDHLVWRPLMAILTSSPPPEQELLTNASSTLCNLLLEFSPAKEPILEQGAVKLLCSLTERPEPALRLNGIWALMNMAFQAEQRLKSQIFATLGTDQIFRLLADSDTSVLMKTLGLLRNLVSPRAHTDAIMALHSAQVMQAVILVLEGPHSPEVKEQALCILGNIADGEKAKEHIMTNEDVLKKLIGYITHPNTKLQVAAIFCIGNLVRRGEPGASERQARLRDMGVLALLHQLVPTQDALLFEKVKAAVTQFTDT